MPVRVGVVMILALIVSACDRWSEKRVAETKRRGDVVCQAVEAYRAKTGKYPFQLADLQPEFLRQIPQPTAGAKEWKYIVIDNGTNYYLQVLGSEFGPILGRTKKDQWDYMKGYTK